MSDSKLDFSKARPGDVLWSDRFGRVEFTRYKDNDPSYPIQCHTQQGHDADWTKEGKCSISDVCNDLHWSRPVFEEPPPPKRMKKVRIERRVHVRQFSKERFETITSPYGFPCPPECITHFDISHEFEVEEE